MIEVSNLKKTYPARGRRAAVEAVRGISFTVGKGELFGLLGPNGAGKSTTLGCITTLVRPSSGTIRIAGIDAARDPAAVKRRIGVVPQTRNLDRDLTVRELLVYHARYFGIDKRAAGARADRLLAELDIAAHAGARAATLSA